MTHKRTPTPSTADADTLRLFWLLDENDRARVQERILYFLEADKYQEKPRHAIPDGWGLISGREGADDGR